MNFEQFFAVLRARYRIAVYVLLVTVSTTAVVSLLLPKSYQASAEIVVDYRANDQVAGGMAMPTQLIPGYMATQMDIIRSRRVGLKVVERLKLYDNPLAKEQFQEATGGKGNVRDWLADLLQKKLEVEPSRESSVVRITYSANDPKFAAVLANAFAQAYIDTNLELKVEPARQSSVWFDEQIKDLRTNLEQAQAKLSDYQRAHGIADSAGRLDVESARLAELSSQLVAVQGMVSDTDSKERQARAYLEQGNSLDSLPEALSNGFIQSLKAEVSRAESKLHQVSSQLGRNHPEYHRLGVEVDELRRKLNEELKVIVDGIGNAARVNRQRASEISAAVSAQKNKILELKHRGDEVSVLSRDVESAQRAYDLAMQRLTQTSLESRSEQTNVVLLTSAIEPLDYARPRILLNIMLSTVLGAMLGVGVALALEMLDLRVRTVEGMAQGLGVPVLGILGEVPDERWLGRFEKWLARLFALRVKPAES